MDGLPSTPQSFFVEDSYDVEESTSIFRTGCQASGYKDKAFSSAVNPSPFPGHCSFLHLADSQYPAFATLHSAITVTTNVNTDSFLRCILQLAFDLRSVCPRFLGYM
jgi:hypothetical protein